MRALLTAGLAFLLAFAGCLGASESPQLQTAQDTPADGPANAANGASGLAPNVTAPRPAGNDSALVPLPGENLATAWVRSFWGERTRVTLIDDTGSISNEGDSDVLNCMLSCNNAFFAPPEGAFVAPGARSVEVTATWTPPPTAPGMAVGLAYRTAADADEVFQWVNSGETVIIPVTDKDADAPLAPRSQWWFSFFPQATPAGSVTPTDIAVMVMAQRGSDLPVFTDPKDPWSGRGSVVLRQAEGNEQIWFTPESFSCFECQTGWDSSGPGLVGEGAQRVEATLAWNWPGPAKPILYYWNSKAGQETAEAVPLTTDDATSRVFILEGIPADQWDSPYQQRSTWGFWVGFEGGPVPAGTAIGTLQLDVSVFR
jgi:hypothetical protein